MSHHHDSDAVTCTNSVAAYLVSRSVQSSKMYSLRFSHAPFTGRLLSVWAWIPLLLLFSACFLYCYRVNYRWSLGLCQACAGNFIIHPLCISYGDHDSIFPPYNFNVLIFCLDTVKKLCYNIVIENAMTQTSRQRITFREMPEGARHQVGNCWTHCWAAVLNRTRKNPSGSSGSSRCRRALPLQSRDMFVSQWVILRLENKKSGTAE